MGSTQTYSTIPVTQPLQPITNIINSTTPTISPTPTTNTPTTINPTIQTTTTQTTTTTTSSSTSTTSNMFNPIAQPYRPPEATQTIHHLLPLSTQPYKWSTIPSTPLPIEQYHDYSPQQPPSTVDMTQVVYSNN